MHQALYRKWRPKTFEDVYGQDHITRVLKYEAEHGLFSHAYLFCGSRGTGKTTCAKILAKVVNCEHPVNGSPCGECESCKLIENSMVTDILEMDAASNNSVDNIRDIRDEVVYSPSALKYRVYIIDEVHMLSGSAFNALLKTLEEPPAHVIFILATTELHKLPSTIISRCQRFDFRRIAIPDLMRRICYIAEEEGIALTEDAAFLIAKTAQGGMRDSISLLELCAGTHQTITPDLVNETLGSVGRSSMLRIVKAIANEDYEAILREIDDVVQSSKDILVFWQDLISVYRDLLVIRTSKDASKYLDLTENEAQELREVASLFTKEVLLSHSKLLEEGLAAMQKGTAIKRITAEFTLIRMCDARLSTSAESLLSRISMLERTVEALKRSGVTVQAESYPAELVDDVPPPEDPYAESFIPPVEAPPPAPAAKPQGTAPVPQRAEPAPAPFAPPTEKPAKKAEQGKRVLRQIRGWAEVVQHFEGMHPDFRAMLGSVKAYQTDDGMVILRFPNAFQLFNFERNGSRDQLRGELSYLLKRDVKDRELVMEIAERSAERSDGFIDEIIDLIEE